MKKSKHAMFRRRCVLRCFAASGPFDPYKILGIDPSASPAQIKKRYHELALRFHPDSGKEGNKERFQAVNEAYEAVKDGKWSGSHPFSSQQHQQSSGGTTGGAYGYDAKSKMYVYEKPGSTSDNYVSSNGRLQTALRLAMIWCAAFFTLRFLLLVIFPLNQDPKRKKLEEAQRAAELKTASVHHDEDEELQRKGGQGEVGGNGEEEPATFYSFVKDDAPSNTGGGGGWR